MFNFPCLLSSAARLLFQFDTATAMQGECRAELARAMLSRSPQSPLTSQLQLQS
jgi:hypothetical protein